MLRITLLLVALIASSPARAELQAEVIGQTGHKYAIIRAGKKPVFTGHEGTPPLTLIHATLSTAARVPLAFTTTSDNNTSAKKGTVQTCAVGAVLGLYASLRRPSRHVPSNHPFRHR